MAPKELIGRYKLYKSKTKGLLYWLTKTAAGCCDLKTVIKSLSASGVSSKKRKGVDTAEIEIRTAELVKLAEAISKAEPAIDVPEGVILIVEDVIKGREECGDWYAAQALEGGGKVEKENETHRYFILVLRKILELLKAARAKLCRSETVSQSSKKSKAKKSGKKTKVDDDGSLGSLFACLDLEEPGENALGDEPPPQLTDTAAGRKKVTYKLETDDEDSAFEIWCFLQDLNDVRTFVKEAWTEYSKGEISFLAASSITDTAFGLMRCADEDIIKTSKLQTSAWPKIYAYLGLTWFCRGRALWLCPDPHSHTAEPRLPNSDTNIVELLCPIATLCIGSYQKDASFVCQHYKQGTNAHPTVKCGSHHYHDICCVFGKLTPGLHHISHCHAHEHKLIDEFVQGLVAAHMQLEPPMWLIVACQVYLDIYDLLGDHLDYGVQALQDTLDHHRQLATEVREYEAATDVKMNDVRAGVDKLEWIAKAAVRFDETVNMPIEGVHLPIPKKQQQAKDEFGLSASVMERSLPAYAGALLTDLKVGVHEIGVYLTNHHLFVLSTAHIYKALRAMDVLKTEWIDMDFVLSLLGIKVPPATKAGSKYDGAAAFRHYALATGISATEFAADSRRKAGDRLATKPIAQISITSPLLKAFNERQNTWQRHGIGHTKSRMVEAVLHALTADESEKTTSSSSRGSHRKESYTPSQLLKTFKKTLLHDEPVLNFDLVSFTLSCARLLEGLTSELGPLLNVDPTAKARHCSFVDRLLCSSPSGPAAAGAASLLTKHIELHGKVNIKKAYDQSSGRIPKDLRPSIQRKQETIRDARDLMCTMFDYANTKYAFSGRVMAAYHPGVKPEICDGKTKCGHELHKGAETDPNGRDANGERKIVSFGTALPQAIVDMDIANCEKDRSKFNASRARLMDNNFRDHARGLIKEDFLRSQARGLMGLELVRTGEPSEFDEFAGEGMTGWVYVLQPGTDHYEAVMTTLKDTGDDEVFPAGAAIMVPVPMLSTHINMKLVEENAAGRLPSRAT